MMQYVLADPTPGSEYVFTVQINSTIAGVMNDIAGTTSRLTSKLVPYGR